MHISRDVINVLRIPGPWSWRRSFFIRDSKSYGSKSFIEINPLAPQGVASILNAQFSTVFLVITFTGIFSAIAFRWIVRNPTYDKATLVQILPGPVLSKFYVTVWPLIARFMGTTGAHLGPTGQRKESAGNLRSLSRLCSTVVWTNLWISWWLSSNSLRII